MWELILVTEAEIKESALASDYHDRYDDLTHGCSWNFCILWIYCCSTSYNIVERHRHVHKHLWHSTMTAKEHSPLKKYLHSVS